MKTLVILAIMSVVAVCIDARNTPTEEKFIWRDELEVPKSCWKFFLECYSGCVMNDDVEHEEYFYCTSFCTSQKKLCERDSKGYWEEEEKEEEEEKTEDRRRE
ncbi:hypothetical protein LSAT2_015842 [Lamellibrachia satsuma]|nr:hypothetical protein LSAT2_015842 [Lamellibrachia satsuma]